MGGPGSDAEVVMGEVVGDELAEVGLIYRADVVIKLAAGGEVCFVAEGGEQFGGLDAALGGFGLHAA